MICYRAHSPSFQCLDYRTTNALSTGVTPLTREGHSLEALQEPNLTEMEEAVPNDDALNLPAHGEARIVRAQWAVQVIVRHV